MAGLHKTRAKTNGQTSTHLRRSRRISPKVKTGDEGSDRKERLANEPLSSMMEPTGTKTTNVSQRPYSIYLVYNRLQNPAVATT